MPSAEPIIVEPAIPEIRQAEIYIGEDCALVRNSKTERVVDHARAVLPGSLYTMPDIAALLEEIHRLVRGRRVFIAFGDSTTANIHNWPYALFTRHLPPEEWIAVNLADWARSSEQHVPVLEFFLDWLRGRGPAATAVAVMLGLRDIHDRLHAYQEYLDGGRASFALETEERLSSHRHGRQLADLLAYAPADWGEAENWIARRILAGVEIMRRLCAEAEVPFVAILEPSAYEDCTPGYLRALRDKFEQEADGGDFAAWCREHRYVPSPSWIGPRDHRPFLEALRGLWRRQAAEGMGPSYHDCSLLFHDVAGCCFQEQFDAVHYNQTGARLIADEVARLMALPFGAGGGGAGC